MLIRIARRILLAIPLLIGITLISFCLMKWAPGDPTTLVMDPTLSMEDLAQIRENIGLNRPLLVQYLDWLGHIVRGEFGRSMVSGRLVSEMILERLWPTLLLTGSAFVLTLIVTLPLGILTGYAANSRFDVLITVLSFIGFSLPSFWVGLMLIVSLSLSLGLFPTSGYLSPHLVSASRWVQMVDILRHLVLPLVTMVITGVAGLIRYQRFSIIQVLGEDYIKAARARGISEKRILFKHAFKNAVLPIVTLVGLQLPGLFGGAFVIETIFSWPGLGQLGVSAVFSRDYTVLMALLLISSSLILVGNLMADLMYRFADPRIREEGV